MRAGFHRLVARTRDASGVWSLSNSNSFYYQNLPATPPALANINKAEYFLDTDPGYGNGVNIPVATPGTDVSGLTYAVSLTGVRAGFHRLVARTRDVNGVWSLSNSNSFYYQNLPATPPGLPNVTRIEYYFDTDPGFGSGINVPIATPAPDVANVGYAADLSVLPNGAHRLFVRSRDADGKWSLVSNTAFTKSGCASATSYAAGLPTASYLGTNSGNFAGSVSLAFNTDPAAPTTSNSAYYVNTGTLQADLGTSQTVSEVRLRLTAQGVANNITITTQTAATTAGPFTTIDTYVAPLVANTPLLVARPLATPVSARVLRFQLQSSNTSYAVTVSGAGIFNFNCVTPSITTVAPNAGPVGTSVTITGANLQGTSVLTFAGASSNTVTSGFTVNAAGTQITGIVVPGGAATGNVTATSPNGTSNGVNFTVTPGPALTSIAPSSGVAGSTVVLSGTNLTGTSVITFAGTANNTVTTGYAVNAAGTQITGIVVPTGAATGNVSVVTPGGTSNGVLFTLTLPAPALSSLNPTNGPVGTSVTISGTDLSGATSVSFNGTLQTTIAGNTATSLTVAVPTGATTGNVTVTTPNGTSNGLAFTVTAAQLAVSQGGTGYPSNGAAYGFGSQVQNTSSSAVAFTLTNAGTAPLTISSISTTGNYGTTGANPSSIAAGSTATVSVVFTPTTAGTRTGTLVIGSGLGTYTVNLTGTGVVAPPTLTSLSPTSGPVGTSVTLTGTDLGGATSVSFNGTVVTSASFTSNSATSIVLNVPTGATTGNVTVTTPNGTSNGLTFTVTAAQLAVSQGGTGYPSNGAAYGFGNQVQNTSSSAVAFTLTNSGSSTLTISSVTATGDFATSGTLPTSVVAGGTGTVSAVFTPTATGARAGSLVIVSNAGTYTLNLSGTGTAPAPAISGFTPTTGPAGTSVTISGTNLSGTTAVAFNGTSAGPITGNTATSLTVAAPVGGTDGPICVTTAGGTACSTASYLYPPTLATGTISPGAYCTGATITIPFSTNTARYAAGNTFNFQLSDATGVFAANAPLLGTLQSSNASGGVLTGTVPPATPAGSGYRVRVVASNPAVTGADNGSNITLNALPTVTATSNSPVAQGGTVVLNGGPAATGNGYVWTASYSGGGTATVSTQQNPQLTNAQASQSGTYTLTITNAAGCSASATTPVTITPPVPVTTLTLSAFNGPLCPGTGYTLSYTAGGPSFGVGNVISAVLSDASGAFSASSPVVGSVSTTSASAGTVGITIPAGTVSGSGYRLRLESSSPVIISNDNGSALTITNLSAASAGSNSPVTAGSTITLTATGISGATYAWTGPNGYTANGPNQSIANAGSTNAGQYTVTIALNGCSTTASTTVVVNAAPVAASIQTGTVSGSYCAGTSVSVPFTAVSFTAGNVFTAQLSNASGSFGSPVALGTLAGIASGTIAGLLPVGTAAGTGYRIRVVGSQPATAGADNGSNLAVTAFGLNTWLGTAGTDWFDPANWSCGQVPTSTSTVVIPGGSANYPLLGAGTPAATHLTVAPGAALTLTGTLTLLGNLTNNGILNVSTGTLVCAGTAAQTLSGGPLRLRNLTVNNPAGVTLQTALGLRQVLTLVAGNLASAGNLTLESDATGTAMVVNPAGGGTVTGLATAQRYVSPALNPGLGYRHFAAPVAGATVADLHGPGLPNPVVSPAYNAAANPFLVTPFPTVFTYNEARLAATPALSSTFDFGWQSPALADGLAAGLGYTVNLAPTTLALTGTLRTGSYAVPLTRGPTANSGWQMLGNPYPAPLNWDNLTRPAGMDNALYTFQSSGPYAGAYLAYVNNVGPAGANLVASGQAFFGRVSSGSPTLTFTDAARETAYSSPVQYRGAAETRPILELTLQGTAPAAAPADVLYVYQEAGASAAFDSRYDALKVILNGGQQPTLYQQAGPESLSIQGLPAGTQPQVLPLGVNAPTAGPFVFTPQRLANFPAAATLYLEDRLTGAWHNLRTGPYAATLAPGLSTARFVLHLNPAQGPLATGVGAPPFAELQVYPNPATTGATVQVLAVGQPAALAKAQLDVLNSVGQRVYHAAGPATVPAGSLRLTVPAATLAAGVYTVRLTTATGVLTRKLLLN